MVAGSCCVVLTWQDKNCSECLLPEMSRGENCIDAFFFFFSPLLFFVFLLGLKFQNRPGSKQALQETLYSASVLSYSLTRNTEECFTSQFAMGNLAE